MSHATLLGALMLDNDAFPDVAKIVGAADFTSASAPLDAVTVCERLRASGALALAGGTEALAALVDQAPGAHSALRLARAAPAASQAPDCSAEPTRPTASR